MARFIRRSHDGDDKDGPRNTEAESVRAAASTPSGDEAPVDRFLPYSLKQRVDAPPSGASERADAAPPTDVAASRGYGELGDHVAGVLASAERAAEEIRQEALREAEAIRVRARDDAVRFQREAEERAADAERVRSEADAYSAGVRSGADSYAEERRRDADAEAGRLIEDAERKAAGVAEAAERRAREIEEAARRRGRELEAESSGAEAQLRELLAMSRDIAERLSSHLESGGDAEPDADDLDRALKERSASGAGS